MNIVLNVMGFCYLRLQDQPNAIQTYKRSLSLNGTDIGSLVALGALLYEIDRESAVRACFRAASLNPPISTPYVLLAHHFFGHADAAKTFEFASRTLEWESRANVRAGLLVTRAIARDALGHHHRSIIHDFEQAMREAPDDPKFRRAYQDFATASTHERDAGKTTMLWSEDKNDQYLDIESADAVARASIPHLPELSLTAAI